MKKSVPLEDVRCSYFPVLMQVEAWGKHWGQSGGKGSKGKMGRAFVTVVAGTFMGQELKHMLGFVVGGFLYIFLYIFTYKHAQSVYREFGSHFALFQYV